MTEEIVKDIGEAWYTLKVDGTKDPPCCKNIRYVDTRNTTKQCDAKYLTRLVLAQLREDAENRAGGIAEREVPYVHCFNHQLHLVVVQALYSDFAMENFFEKGACSTKEKACLIQITVEKDITKKLTGEWKDMLLRRFSTTSRRLSSEAKKYFL
ncbi:unnamed protein product [Lepeophtheirus salmonis]|uniref:(salmon louse) hypothetical protein n=1 Tax=Lepeophtheirus salmonis TaxID=72036 RepID=A0A7R8H5G0_LEPSM|nr:unnamed protein product [Lepeophtheirus salmonis]CAF2882064.1 unnamed protein product [Lepeophtheirus salmonis]